MATSSSNLLFDIESNFSSPSRNSMAEQDIHMAYHLERLGQGKTVYLFSPAQVSSMQDSGKAIEDFADDLMKRLNTHVFVHQNMETFVYRIGQVLDQFDFYETRKLVLVYVADPNKPRQVITTPPPASPIMGAALQSAPNPTISMGSSLPSVVNTTLAPQVKKIPKPANSWILYRKSKHHLVVAQNPGMHTSEISTIIGKMWKIEDPSVKAFWQAAADNEKKAHALRNPGYRITPRKSSAIKRRKTKKTSTVQVSGHLSPTVYSDTARPQEQVYPQLQFSQSLPFLEDSSNIVPLNTTSEEINSLFADLDKDFNFQLQGIDGQFDDLFLDFNDNYGAN